MMEKLDKQQSQIQQLADGFDLTTGRFLQDSQHKAELAKATGDKGELVKEQIKIEILRQTRAIFAHNYRRVTGSEPWSMNENG